nr:hypothetical protein [Tanacetum cinerariifolium]
MVNVIPPDHVDDVPVVDLNQHDDVPVVPEPVLVNEDEDPEEDEFKKEEDPQEEDDDTEVDIEKDGNELKLTYPYKEQGTTVMKKLVEKLGNAKDKVECKKLKKELEELRFKNTFLRMQNERVKVDLYWTRTRAHEFYQEMIRRGFVFEERPNKAINVLIEDEKSPSSKGSGPVRGQDVVPAVCECTFAGFMKCNPTTFHGTEGAVKLLRWFEKTKRVFGISKCAEGKKVKFATATLQEPALTWWNAKIATMVLETVKEYNIVAYTQRFNELTLMCLIMVKPERVKVDAYIRGLTHNVKGEVTSSKPVNLNEAMCMAYKLMEQKSQARDEIILKGNKRKWENFQSGNSSGKGNHRDNSRQTLQNNQKQGNTRAMVTAPTNGRVSSGSLPLCESCFTRHVGLCTIKFHKYGKVGHKIRYCK